MEGDAAGQGAAAPSQTATASPSTKLFSPALTAATPFITDPTPPASVKPGHNILQTVALRLTYGGGT